MGVVTTDLAKRLMERGFDVTELELSEFLVEDYPLLAQDQDSRLHRYGELCRAFWHAAMRSVAPDLNALRFEVTICNLKKSCR